MYYYCPFILYFLQQTPNKEYLFTEKIIQSIHRFSATFILGLVNRNDLPLPRRPLLNTIIIIVQ